jgi:NADH-quinone oxidoreductase subunit G
VGARQRTINECWLSDRRYSHEGLYANDRATKPMIRKDGELVESTWEEAIAFVVDGLKKHAGDELGALVAPLTSSEEGWLLANIVRALGSDNIDHRLRTLDFADGAPVSTFEMPLAQIEKAKSILLVGANPRHEQPLLGARIRKAWKRGAKVCHQSIDFDLNFDLAGKTIATRPAWSTQPWPGRTDDGHMPDPDAPAGRISAIAADEAARNLLAALKQDGAVVIFGDSAVQHAGFAAARGGLCRSERSGLQIAAWRERRRSRPLRRRAAVRRSVPRHCPTPTKALLAYHFGCRTRLRRRLTMRRAATLRSTCASALMRNGVKRTAHAVLPVGCRRRSTAQCQCRRTVQTGAAG